MTRLITLELNKKLKKEYRLRFLSTLFFSLGLVFFIHMILALSSYILLNMYEKIYQKSLQADNGEALKQYEDFVARTSNIITLSKKIPKQATVSATDIFEKIQTHGSNQISFNVFELQIAEDKKNITIRGAATTRDALIEFNDKMKTENAFSDFAIPLETLTKQRDISFEVTFTYNEN